MYYWRKLVGKLWQCYRLVCPDGTIKDFDTYESLYDYCKKNNIDAMQA